MQHLALPGPGPYPTFLGSPEDAFDPSQQEAILRTQCTNSRVGVYWSFGGSQIFIVIWLQVVINHDQGGNKIKEVKFKDPFSFFVFPHLYLPFLPNIR